MKRKENTNRMTVQDKVVLILLTTIPSLFLIILHVHIHWLSIKGTYLIDTNALVETTGIITSSNTYSEKSRFGTSYYYAITYEYRVNGKNFSSHQVNFGPNGFDSHDLAMAYTNKYPIGDKVKVSYEANDPNFSVLDPSVKDKSLLGLVCILAIFPGIPVFIAILKGTYT